MRPVRSDALPAHIVEDDQGSVDTTDGVVSYTRLQRHHSWIDHVVSGHVCSGAVGGGRIQSLLLGSGEW